ncbi:MAG: methyltransferase, partial [Caldimonas sp.]
MTPLDDFLSALGRALDDGSFSSLVLSKNRRAGDDLQSVRVRPIELRGRRVLSFVHHHATRDV